MKSRPQVGTAQGWGHQGDPRRPCSGGGGRGLCPSRQDRGFILWGHSHLLFLPLPAPGPGGGQVAPGKGSPRLHGGGHEAQSTVPCPPVLRRSDPPGSADTSLAAPGRAPGEKRCPFHPRAVCSHCQALQRELGPAAGGVAPEEPAAAWTGCVDWLCPAASLSRAPGWNYSPGPHLRGGGASRLSGCVRTALGGRPALGPGPPRGGAGVRGASTATAG